jgi:hypothetical protein
MKELASSGPSQARIDESLGLPESSASCIEVTSRPQFEQVSRRSVAFLARDP